MRLPCGVSGVHGLSLVPRGLAIIAVLAIGTALGGQRAHGQFDMDVEQKLLIDLLRDGKYRQALSEARRIEKIVKPAKKNPVIGPGTQFYVNLLIYQGLIERRMGSLDAADKTLTEAFKQFSDPAFQQFLGRGAPSDEKDQLAYFLSIELPYLQLIDQGTEVLLERIRSANQQLQLQGSGKTREAAGSGAEQDTAAAESTATADRDQIVTWFRKVDDLIRMSQSARSAVRGRFAEPGKEDNTPLEALMADSPQSRVTASLSQPYRFVGLRYLEASKLPWTLSFDTDTPPDEAGSRKTTKASEAEPIDEPAEERLRQAASQRLRATAYLQRSISMAEDAMAPVLRVVASDEAKADGDTKFIEKTRLAAKQEAARIRAERLIPLAEVALLDDDLDAARSSVDTALSALREAEPPHHPELARPLITSAEVAFAESRRSLQNKDALAARDQSQLAVESLREAQRLLTAKDSAFDPNAPLHVLLASQLAVAESFASSSSQAAAADSATDAAARRALAAIKAMPKPKPVPPAAAPDPKAAKPSGPATPPTAAPGTRRP
jgi:hypothetical protein